MAGNFNKNDLNDQTAPNCVTLRQQRQSGWLHPLIGWDIFLARISLRSASRSGTATPAPQVRQLDFAFPNVAELNFAQLQVRPFANQYFDRPLATSLPVDGPLPNPRLGYAPRLRGTVRQVVFRRELAWPLRLCVRLSWY